MWCFIFYLHTIKTYEYNVFFIKQHNLLHINQISYKVTLITTQDMTPTPGPTSKDPSSCPAPCLVRGPFRWNSKNTAYSIRKPLLDDRGCLKQRRSAQLLRVFEHQKEVQMSNEDSQELQHAPAGYYQVEGQEYPG